VLVHADEEVHVAPGLAVVPGDGVGADLLEARARGAGSPLA
jgi:hypothetical protein